MTLLERLLKKLKVDDYSKLTDEDKVTFKQWEEELRGKPVTIENLRKFLRGQMQHALSQFEDFENSKTKDLYLKVYSRICRQIIDFIETPAKVKQMREDALEEKVKK